MAKDEILVVGAGPVGLVMAAELSRHGVKCRIIDKNTNQADDSRAVGVHARTLEVYEDIGIVDEALEKGVKVVGLNLYSRDSQLIHTAFRNLDSRYNFVLDMPQSLTEPMLINHLKSFGVEVERNVELNNLEQQDDQVEVMLKHGEHSLVPETFAYVIGCDGARSTCRHLLEIPFPGEEYPSSWVVLDSALDWPYDSQELHLFLHEKGLTAFFPLPGNRMRITYERFMSRDQDELPKVTYDHARQALQERVSKKLKLVDPKDLSPFIIHHRQVTQYRKGRVFLAGDAAHLHSPAGGQGMNTGIQDAYNLAWKLALVHQGISPKKLLDTYHIERHPIGKWVLNVTDRITRMMTVKNSVLSFLRDTLLTAANHIDKVKTQMPKRFSQLYLHYELNDFIYESCQEHHPLNVRAGHRAPDHELKETRLFKLFQGTHHTLLLFSGKKPDHEDLEGIKKIEKAVKQYDKWMHTYLLIRNEEDLKLFPNTTACFEDREPSVHSHYGVEKSTAMLIRPDGVIAFVNQPPLETPIKKYFFQLVKC